MPLKMLYFILPENVVPQLRFEPVHDVAFFT